MNQSDLKICDETDELVEPRLHDGHLLGIRIPEQGKIELDVSDRFGKQYRIELAGVVAFHASDFREGNIILNVIVLHGERVQMDDFELLEGWYCFLNKDGYREKLYQQVIRESLYVVQLIPSYGCELIGIAKQVSVFHDPS